MSVAYITGEVVNHLIQGGMTNGEQLHLKPMIITHIIKATDERCSDLIVQDSLGGVTGVPMESSQTAPQRTLSDRLD